MPGAIKLFDGARCLIHIAIEIAIGKYLDPSPLERRVRIMRREDLEIDSQTLWDQVDRLAQAVKKGVRVHPRAHLEQGRDRGG